ARFVISPSDLNVSDQGRYGGFEVYEEVGSFDIVDDAMEHSAVAFKVPRAHQAHVVQVLGKYISIFIDGTVLNHIDAAFLQINNMLETAVQKEYLYVECPPLHVSLEFLKIRVVVYSFKQWFKI